MTKAERIEREREFRKSAAERHHKPTIGDGKAPTWEYALPIVFAVLAGHTSGLGHYLFVLNASVWVTLLFLWHCGWRKTFDSREPS